MDLVGPTIAAELERVKVQLKRERNRRWRAERSRDLWKQHAQTRQARLEYRSRARAA
jgi:hypothetical protein